MKVRKYDSELFEENYLSTLQIKVKLADTQIIIVESGRGSGKTTHIMAPRVDRVSASMPGATSALASSTYKSIIDNIVPGIVEYLSENYERGAYFEIGQKPPKHFAKCYTFIQDWRHTVSFADGHVIQFVSCDRPESMLGKNAAHLHADELLRIPEDKFTERIIPALRSNRAKFGHSPYFMGISGYSSTPNFETDHDWWTKYEQNMNPEIIEIIQEISYEIDLRMIELIKAQNEFDSEAIEKHQKFISRWLDRVNQLKRNQTYYVRASSFSNLKILGIDYIENQIKSIKDLDKLNTSIFSVRKNKVKERFWGRFGKEHIYEDSYDYKIISNQSIADDIEIDARSLNHYDANGALYIGYDPGPFSSVVMAQYQNNKKEFRIIKDFWVIHPSQHEEMADLIAKYFKHHRRKQIILHYDRAANQRDPKYREYYPVTGDMNDTDAIMLKKALEKLGWSVMLMSLGQPVIYYSQLYRLLNVVFGKNEGNRADVMIDGNECEACVSSIFHSPVKRTSGKIELDKSSERLLEYKDQAFYSTQISSAAMYLIWGEFKKLLPSSDSKDFSSYSSGIYTS